MLIREAGDEDIDVVADLRLRFLAEHRGIDAASFADGFRASTVSFLRRHAATRTGRSWLAEDDGAAAGVVTMLLLDLAPRPEDATGLEGYIVNMYVEPGARRRGVGRSLLEACLAAAHESGLRRLLLYATESGEPLYVSVGFASNPRWMELPVALAAPDA